MRRQRIDVAEHLHVGADLARICADVYQLATALQNAYGKTTGASRHALRAVAHLDRLHARLEDDYEIAAGKDFSHATYNAEARVPILRVPREMRRGRVPGRLTVDEHRDLAAHLRNVLAAVVELHHRVQRAAGNHFAETMANIVYDVAMCRNALAYRLFGEHRREDIYDDEPPSAPPSTTIQAPPAREPWRSERGQS